MTINLNADVSWYQCALVTCRELFPPLTGDQWVLFEVARQHQTEKDGEAQDKEVPGGVEIDKLQVGQSHSCDHTKQGAEQSPQDRVRQGGKEGAEFTHKPQQQHHGSSILNHTSAADLEEQPEIRRITGKPDGAKTQDALFSLRLVKPWLFSILINLMIIFI